MTTFAAWLNEQMHQRRIGTYDLAEAIGARPNTIGYWRRGIHVPLPETIEQLAELFGADCDNVQALAVQAVLRPSGRGQRIWRSPVSPIVPAQPRPQPVFAAWLQAQLRDRRLSYRQFARAMGLSGLTVRHWLAGDFEPLPLHAAQLATFFGVSPEDVIGLTEWRRTP